MFNFRKNHGMIIGIVTMTTFLYAWALLGNMLFVLAGAATGAFVVRYAYIRFNDMQIAGDSTAAAREYVRYLNVGDQFDETDKDAIMSTGGVKSVVGSLVEVDPVGKQRNPRVVPCTEFIIIEDQVEFVVLDGVVSDIVYRIN